MADENDTHIESGNQSRVILSRPSYAQVKALVEFMQQHQDLAHKKYRHGMSHEKFHKLWIEVSNIVNSLEGAVKSTKGWIKFWSDKKRCIKIKQKQIEEGKLHDSLSLLEKKILDLSYVSTLPKKKKAMKVEEPCNGNDDETMDDTMFATDGLDCDQDKSLATEIEERQFNLLEKLVNVMSQQASALSQVAQASLNNAKALERLAEASHIQALAVDRMANTFDSVTGSVHDVRNAIASIDYTMKRCYTASTQHRQNSNIFS